MCDMSTDHKLILTSFLSVSTVLDDDLIFILVVEQLLLLLVSLVNSPVTVFALEYFSFKAVLFSLLCSQ